MTNIYRYELRRFLLTRGLNNDRVQHIVDLLDPFYRMSLNQRFVLGRSEWMKNDLWHHVSTAAGRPCTQIRTISLQTWSSQYNRFNLGTYPIHLIDEIAVRASRAVDSRVQHDLSSALNLSLANALKEVISQSFGEPVAHATWPKLHGLLRAWLMAEISATSDRKLANALEHLVSQCTQGFVLLGTERINPEVAVFLSV